MNGIVKKIVCGLAVCTIGLAGVAVLKYVNRDKDLIGNRKYQQKVVTELGADMQIMQDYSFINGYDIDKLVRLRPNDSNKIYVGVDEKISGRERENINSAISDFNNVFSNINDAYNFVVCDSEESKSYSREGNTTIDIKYSTLAQNCYGLTESCTNKFTFFSRKKSSNNVYIVGSSIYFDRNVFPKLADVTQLQIIKHEILHTLGFADLYTGYDDETSLMNIGVMGVSTKFSPNDIKMLYVAYGNKHINKDGSYNSEKMSEIKEKIDTYEKMYYKYFIDLIKNNNKNKRYFRSITEEELTDLTFSKNNATITIKNGEYTYTLNGKTKTGKLIIGDDYAIIPDVKRDNRYNKGSMYNDFLILTKHKSKIECFDLDIYHSNTNMIDQAAMGIDLDLT